MKLLPRKEFEITLKGQDYRGKFGTYAYKLFCNKKGIKLQNVESVFPSDADMMDILDEIIELIICAIEYTADKERKTVSLKVVDFWAAVDDKEITNDDLIAIFNHAADEAAKNVNGESPLAGMISSDITTQPEENQTNSGA